MSSLCIANHVIPLIKSKRRNTILERALWLAVGLLALFPLYGLLDRLMYPGGPRLDIQIGVLTVDICVVFVVLFIGIAVFGAVLNWGPTVPCMILGIMIPPFFVSPVASSHAEALFKDLGIPTIGAICGFVIGSLMDRSLQSCVERCWPDEEHPSDPDHEG